MSTPVLDAPWLKEAATQAVMSALAQEGGEPRIVGGAVRHALLNEPVTDVDMATLLKPQEVLACLSRHNIKAIPTGIDHGTVTAVTPERHFEITTLRRDIATDGRHATVEYGTDWREDASRRDFTFNALYADAQGNIYDPLGGYADLVARRVCFIGDARARIREDYLRILRYFRFQARYGGTIDRDALKACEDEKEGLAKLSAERIQKEFLLLLAGAHAADVLDAMQERGILSAILPDTGSAAGKVAHVRRLVAALDGKAADAILRLGALIADEAAQVTAQRLKLSHRDEKRLIAMKAGQKISSSISIALAHRLIYENGAQTFQDRLWLARAADEDTAHMKSWRDLAADASAWTAPSFPLSGTDLLARGVRPGPQMGQLLSELEAYWLDHEFASSKNELLAELDRRLKTQS